MPFSLQLWPRDHFPSPRSTPLCRPLPRGERDSDARTLSPLRNLHRAEFGAAHAAEVGGLGAFRGQGLVVILLGGVGVGAGAEVELAGDPALVGCPGDRREAHRSQCRCRAVSRQPFIASNGNCIGFQFGHVVGCSLSRVQDRSCGRILPTKSRPIRHRP